MLNYFFLVYYSFEATLKIFAFGFFFPKKAYIKDYWNILDFIVLGSSYLPFFLDENTFDLSFLKSFRILRPLRTISSVPVNIYNIYAIVHL